METKKLRVTSDTSDNECFEYVKGKGGAGGDGVLKTGKDLESWLYRIFKAGRN